jgi:hypothetical protein
MTSYLYSEGIQRENAPPPQLLESWVNVAKSGQVAAYQRAHNHLPTGTDAAITSVYYAASGYSDGSSTSVRLGLPGVAGGVDRDWRILKVTGGTLVLFPTYLKHVGDVHLGDADRISIASNIIIK